MIRKHTGFESKHHTAFMTPFARSSWPSSLVSYYKCDRAVSACGRQYAFIHRAGNLPLKTPTSAPWNVDGTGAIGHEASFARTVAWTFRRRIRPESRHSIRDDDRSFNRPLRSFEGPYSTLPHSHNWPRSRKSKTYIPRTSGNHLQRIF